MSTPMPALPLQEFLEAMPDASLVVNDAGVIQLLNERAEALFGYGPRELIGQRIETLVPTRHQGEHSSHRTGYQSERKVRPMGTGHHYTARKKDGSELAVDVSLSPIEVEHQPHTFAVIRDVTRYRRHAFLEIIGKSSAVQCLLSQLSAVAPTNADVLVVGESGVGKELVAKALHDKSPRAHEPLVKVNCASIPRELFESEFFGHLRGAFTGAVENRTGRFAVADGGTLFLDEVGEIPLDLQGKLLRVLQEREFEPVGSHKTVKVDVRVVAATNRDLAAEVQAGRFREDLFYRLNVFPIPVPPLRDRGDDVVLLAEYFLGTASARLGVPRPKLTDDDRQALLQHRWPGNVRELSNLIERALILSLQNEGQLQLVDVISAQTDDAPWRNAPDPPVLGLDGSRIFTAAELKAFEKTNIERALVQTRGRIGGPNGAAQLLGMSRTTLSSRIKALGVTRPAEPQDDPA